jgi:nickel-dependent lactate racemase
MQLRFGNTELDFDLKLPPGAIVTPSARTIDGRACAKSPDNGSATTDLDFLFDNPTDGSAPLAECLTLGRPITIVVSDVTRAWIPTALMLRHLLPKLNALGFPDCDITVLASLGAHRPHTPAELTDLVGAKVLSRVRVVDHDCLGEDLVDLGVTARGTRVAVNRLITGENQVILTGGITFHLMCGFGGGRKSVCPGVAGYGTIQANHRLVLSREAGEAPRPGKLLGNVQHEDMMEIAGLVDTAFLVNMVPTPGPGPYRFVGGHWRKAWEMGCNLLAGELQVPIDEPADLVIASAGGYPYDINLYQTVKTMDHSLGAIKPGGVMIVVSECGDGLGGEEFGEVLASGLEKAEERLRQDFTVPAWAAFRLLQIAHEVKLILISGMPSEQVSGLGVIPAATPAEAIRLAEGFLPANYRTLALPKAASTLPISLETHT